jgi:4-amino-4-deoxy-L-arabinose transferase-like glycosyltransferase
LAERRRIQFLLLIGIIGLRLVTMAAYPMTDPTEPRYAEIARIMATSGDWITPWFTPEVPFWGKPPLAFWTQAASMKLFGVSDFAARLPTWLAMIAVVGLAMRVAFALGQWPIALWSGLILASMTQVFVVGGAVLTDPFLVLGTTLSITGFILTMRNEAPGWRWAIFGGLAVGLLTKGPLALVLVGVPLAAWTVWCRRGRDVARVLPWWPGLALVGVITLPWYVAAELKTPGFLDYFLAGEHFRRFLDPGWAGNLYGRAHDEPRGTIWLHLVGAAFPWSLLALAALVHRCTSRRIRASIKRPAESEDARLMLLAGLTPAAVFTLSGNILWTYVLPGLPWLAILLARAALPALESGRWRGAATALVLLAPVSITIAGLLHAARPVQLKSAAPAIEVLAREPAFNTTDLYYVGKPPHSARFYSRGTVRSVELPAVTSLLAAASRPVYLAAGNSDLPAVQAALGTPFAVCFRGARHTLIRVERADTPGDAESLASAERMQALLGGHRSGESACGFWSSRTIATSSATSSTTSP